MTAQQIYDNFHNAVGPGGLQQAQDNLRAVMKKYEIRSEQINSLFEMVREGWTGGAADAASQSVSRLASAHVEAANAMNTAHGLISNQSQAFFDTKNKVVPVPEVPQMPPTMKEILGDGGGDWSQVPKVAAANAAAKQNVEAMQTWSTTSGDNGSRMPTTYGTLDAGVLGVAEGAQGGVDVGNGATQNGPSLGGAGGASRGGGAVAGGTPSLAGTSPYQPPAGQIPPDGRTVASDAAYAPPAAGGYSPGLPQQGGQGSNNYGTPNPYGVPGGYGNNPGYRGAAPRFGAGSGAGSYGRGAGAGGAGRGFGPGGTGAGTGGNPLSEGKRFGAGNPAAAEAGLRGTAGSGGRSGATGHGAMGAGAGNRGQGDDDNEHQRKYIVDEDEHFQLTAEGEKAVDPITGMTVSPPVLGQ